MSLTIYAAPMSSATPVVHALAELDVPCEHIPVDLSAGDQRKPEFLALNPNGKVPLLVVDGTPMFEAVAIMQWLGDRYGVDKGLWPAAEDPARLEALSWSTWAYVSFGANLSRFILTTSDRAPQALHNKAHAEHSDAELQTLLGLLNDRLASRAYLLGEKFGLVDLIVGNTVTYGTFCGLSVEAHAHVQEWLSRLHARPAYKKVWLGTPQ